MSQEDLIKQAYAYGMTVALQEAGIPKETADQYAAEYTEKQAAMLNQEKVAEEPSMGQRLLTSAGGAPAAAMMAPEGEGYNTFGHVAGKGALGQLAGVGAGGAGGAGLGALISLLSKGKIKPSVGAQIGGVGGAIGGGILGNQLGMQRGLTSAMAQRG